MSDTNHFGSWKLQHEFTESYGAFYASLLNDVLGLLDGVSDRSKSIHEARIDAIARFRAVMEEHVPACHETLVAYQARLAEEQAEETRTRVAAYELREKQRLAEELRQRARAAAADRSQRDAVAKEQKLADEHKTKFAAEQKAIQDERERKQAEQAAQLESDIPDGGPSN